MAIFSCDVAHFAHISGCIFGISTLFIGDIQFRDHVLDPLTLHLLILCVRLADGDVIAQIIYMGVSNLWGYP